MFPVNDETRDSIIVAKIRALLSVHGRFAKQSESVEVTYEDSAVVLSGQLPNASLKNELVHIVRQAGVLCRVNNNVTVKN